MSNLLTICILQVNLSSRKGLPALSAQLTLPVTTVSAHMQQEQVLEQDRRELELI